MKEILFDEPRHLDVTTQDGNRWVADQINQHEAEIHTLCVGTVELTPPGEEDGLKRQFLTVLPTGEGISELIPRGTELVDHSKGPMRFTPGSEVVLVPQERRVLLIAKAGINGGRDIWVTRIVFHEEGLSPRRALLQ